MRTLPFSGIPVGQYEMVEESAFRRLSAHMADLDSKVPYPELLEGE